MAPFFKSPPGLRVVPSTYSLQCIVFLSNLEFENVGEEIWIWSHHHEPDVEVGHQEFVSNICCSYICTPSKNLLKMMDLSRIRRSSTSFVCYHSHLFSSITFQPVQDIRHQRYPSPWSNWPQRWIQVDRGWRIEFSHRKSWAILIWYQIQKLWNLWFPSGFPKLVEVVLIWIFLWMIYLMYTVYNSQPARRRLACPFPS